MPPVEPIDYKQDAGSADCWDEEVRRFFSRYGVLVDLDLPYQVAKGKPRPVGGEPATFDELVAAVRGIASHSNVNVDSTTVPYLQVLTLNDAAHVSAALDDPDPANKWTIIAGVNGRTLGLTNADGSPASWGHFVTLVRWADASKTRVVVADPASRWDSDSTQVYDWSALVAAMEGPTGNWDPVRDAVAFKIVQ